MEPHQKAAGVVSNSIVGPNPAALLAPLVMGEDLISAWLPGEQRTLPLHARTARSGVSREEFSKQPLDALVVMHVSMGLDGGAFLA